MGKFKKKKYLIILLIVTIVIVLAVSVYLIQKKYHIFSSQIIKQIIRIKEGKTEEGKILIIKDKTAFNKIIEFEFEDNIVKRINIYEEFEDQNTYEIAKQSYNYLKSVNILKESDKELYIFVEKNDFGTDTNLTYEEIYDKYLVQIIDAYELVK